MKATSSSSSQEIQTWNTITNMRSTLLQLQYLYSSISQNLQKQQQHSKLNQQDRLLQIYDLYQQLQQLTSSNYKIILITKLEALLANNSKIDGQIWEKLDQFLGCCRYIEEEMSRDYGRLYVGNGVMLDVAKCQAQLKKLQTRLQTFINQNQNSIQEYNTGIKQTKELEKDWQNYFIEIQQSTNTKIKPFYTEYLRRRLNQREKELESNIKILKKFILS